MAFAVAALCAVRGALTELNLYGASVVGLPRSDVLNAIKKSNRPMTMLLTMSGSKSHEAV